MRNLPESQTKEDGQRTILQITDVKFDWFIVRKKVLGKALLSYVIQYSCTRGKRSFARLLRGIKIKILNSFRRNQSEGLFAS